MILVSAHVTIYGAAVVDNTIIMENLGEIKQSFVYNK